MTVMPSPPTAGRASRPGRRPPVSTGSCGRSPTWRAGTGCSACCWRPDPCYAPPPRAGTTPRRGGTRWLAALAVAPVLLDAYQLNAEQTIMPDVLFEALLVTGIVLLLWQ